MLTLTTTDGKTHGMRALGNGVTESRCCMRYNAPGHAERFAHVLSEYEKEAAEKMLWSENETVTCSRCLKFTEQPDTCGVAITLHDGSTLVMNQKAVVTP